MHLVVSAAVAGTAAVATTIVAAPPSLAASGENDSAEASNFEKELARQRSDVAALKAAWEYSGKAEKIPSRAWPDVQPEPEEIPALAEELKARCGGGAAATRKQAEECARRKFDLGTALLGIPDRQAEGAQLYAEIAASGHQDGITGWGVCLMEGRGVAEDPSRACSLFEQAAAVGGSGSGQPTYELAVAYYQGTGVAEDEVKAAELFARAAELRHTGGLYMAGDCCLEGIGRIRDRAQALQLLRQAGMQGHRGARSRLMALLAPPPVQSASKDTDVFSYDASKFTDASRQSLRR